MATEKEVQQASERVAKLRSQIADEQAKRTSRLTSVDTDVAAAQLAAEEARLTAELEQVKEVAAHEKQRGAKRVSDQLAAAQPVSENAPAMNPAPDGAPTFSPEQVKMLKESGTPAKEVTAELAEAAKEGA